jgi:large subunit ribosomal protein L21
MYAIIEEGGKQYKVTSGDTILIDRPIDSLDDAKSIKFDRVLLVGGEGEPKIGLPTLAKATVSADVIGEEKGDKIDIQKYKRRKGYHKKIGHRQRYVRVKITGINV